MPVTRSFHLVSQPCLRYFFLLQLAQVAGLSGFVSYLCLFDLSVIPHTGVGEGIRRNPGGGYYRGLIGVPTVRCPRVRPRTSPVKAHLKKRDFVHLDSDRSSKFPGFRDPQPSPGPSAT